jgi:hypothetical protein
MGGIVISLTEREELGCRDLLGGSLRLFEEVVIGGSHED